MVKVKDESADNGARWIIEKKMSATCIITLPMLPSLGRVQEELEAVTDSVPVPSQKDMGKLWNHLWNCASRTCYLEPSNMEPARTCSSMNTVTPT